MNMTVQGREPSMMLLALLLAGVVALTGCRDTSSPDDTQRPDARAPASATPSADVAVDVTADPPAGDMDTHDEPNGEVPTPPETAPPTEPPSGEEIVRRHVLAAGGETTPPDGTSRTFTFVIEFEIPGAAERRVEQPTGTMILQRRAPDRLRTHTTISGLGESQGGFDGVIGWAIDGGVARLREGSSLGELRREARFDREIHLDAVYPTASRQGEVERDGVACWHVLLHAEDGTPAHAFFSKETGLLHELVRQLDSPSGPLGVSQRFTEWTDYDGRMYPARIENRAGGTAQRMTLVDVDSTPLDDDLFALPDAVQDLMRDDGTPPPPDPDPDSAK